MKRLLIVDDDPDIVDALAMVLEHRFEIAIAGNGREGLERMAEQPADVVILDLMMPVLDGEGYMAEHRTLHPAVPVIIASAGRNVGAIATRLGAASWLTKPFDLSTLEEYLDRVLGP